MAKVSGLQNNFSAGELSSLVQGRVDADRYKQGVKTCLNFIPYLQGPVVKRSGSYFVSAVKDSTKATRLIPFEFSTTQAYMLEFCGDGFIRFYKDGGIIETSPGVALTLAHPYAESEIFQIKYTQSADTLFLCHKTKKPRLLTRTSHTSWAINAIANVDGPWLATNITATTLTPSAVSGAGITCTASAVTGINGNAGFKVGDVGRSIRIKHGTVWGWATITGFTSTTVVTIATTTYPETSPFGNTTASVDWRMDAWNATEGYPSAVTFHEDRLSFNGPTNYPQRLDLSRTGNYTSFAPTDVNSVVASDNAISVTLNSNDVNAIQWITSDEKGLLVGSVGGEWLIKASSQGEALTPTNISAKRSSSYGSSEDIGVLTPGKSAIFIQRSGRKVREISYYYDVDGFRPIDVSELSEHITTSGIKDFAFQKEPQPIVWCVRNDGVLAAMTYERNVDSLRAGWSRHILGGYSDAANNPAIVESVAAIPSSDGTYNEVWLIVKRRINGSTVRYIEYFIPQFEDVDDQKFAYFVDCGLTYDDASIIEGITKANPAVVTSTAHGYSNGDKLLLSDIEGMSELNGLSVLIKNKAANTYELTDLSGNNINSTSYSTYVSGGEARKYISTVSGLSHLEGQTVKVLADGAVQPDEVVSGGAITMSYQATTINIGLPYTADLQLLRLEAGAADGTALAKTRRMHRVGIYLHRTLGLKIGATFDSLTELVFRKSSDSQTRAVPLFSGIISETIDMDYDFQNELCIRSDTPLPCMILAIAPQMVTQDRG